MNKGKEFEEIAARYLESLGYKLIKRNFHCRGGEIDIIALDGNVLVFVEVKGGKSKGFGDPAERIDNRKLLRMLRCMKEFLADNPLEDYRIEVIIVRDKSIEHFPISL